jgi:hypothetical protein
MSEGTLYAVVQLKTPWPPEKEVIIVQGAQDTRLIQVYAALDGHLVAIVEDSGVPVVHHETQPIAVDKTGMVILTMSWNPSGAQVRINQHTLRPWDTGDLSPQAIQTKQYLPIGPISVEHPDATTQCQNWVSWRTIRLGTPSPPDDGRDLKPAERQIKELEGALARLDMLVQLVAAGQDFQIPLIAVTLRSLIYWQLRNNGRLNDQYNPLLLRIAARLNLPLPIFAFPDDRATQPDVLLQAEVHHCNNLPMMQRMLPAQELMDMQEWMIVPVSTKRFAGLLPGTEKVMASKDVIAEVANTLGGAHFDEDVSQHLERIQAFKAYDTSFVDIYLFNVSKTVVQLGVFVLNQYRKTLPTKQ